MTDREFALTATLGILVIFLVVLFSLSHGVSAKIQTDAIHRGFAQYCPPDGVFAWKGECK